MDVRPHPHINLATVTYLFEGVLLHRDSVGSVQEIRQACGELDDGRARHCPLRTHA
ncbi:pirin family protein [Microcoleus sp. D3_18a_C4]